MYLYYGYYWSQARAKEGWAWDQYLHPVENNLTEENANQNVVMNEN